MPSHPDSTMRNSNVHGFELGSRDERDLRRRISEFGRGICARAGAIYDVRLNRRPEDGEWLATIVYALPVEQSTEDAAE